MKYLHRFKQQHQRQQQRIFNKRKVTQLTLIAVELGTGCSFNRIIAFVLVV